MSEQADRIADIERKSHVASNIVGAFTWIRREDLAWLLAELRSVSRALEATQARVIAWETASKEVLDEDERVLDWLWIQQRTSREVVALANEADNHPAGATLLEIVRTRRTALAAGAVAQAGRTTEPTPTDDLSELFSIVARRFQRRPPFTTRQSLANAPLGSIASFGKRQSKCGRSSSTNGKARTSRATFSTRRRERQAETQRGRRQSPSGNGTELPRSE